MTQKETKATKIFRQVKEILIGTISDLHTLNSKMKAVENF